MRGGTSASGVSNAARSEQLQHGKNDHEFYGAGGDRMSIWWLAAIPGIAVLWGTEFLVLAFGSTAKLKDVIIRER
jgi:hypothetical protein